MTKVFIDGKDGTTGLKIMERFARRSDVQLLSIAPEKRKEVAERRRLINSADICFLCLPDEAAKESVSLVDNEHVKIIDTSTAHRTDEKWCYGFPELSVAHRKKIESGTRIAVPGCHASGFNALIYPLIACGILPTDYPLVCYSVTGYSGGGKRMIAEYEDAKREAIFDAPRQYGLNQNHKHLKEMVAVSSLKRLPIFSPIVADYFSGMMVSVPLFSDLLTTKCTPAQLHTVLAAHYRNSALVSVLPFGAETQWNGMIDSNTRSGKDGMELIVTGNEERILLISRFDNLGKGASGAAIQCMNLLIGIEETTGLDL